MKILSFNPTHNQSDHSHDGAFVYVKDGRLVFSIEAEKNSHWRFSSFSINDMIGAIGEIDEMPDIVCSGGWRPGRGYASWGSLPYAGYRGVDKNSFLTYKWRIFGQSVEYYSSTHERSHLLCAYGLSPLPKGTPCYALVWEGDLGAFYEIDADLNITRLTEILTCPGYRYAALYGLADPTIQDVLVRDLGSDSGKLMALASFSNRRQLKSDEKKLLDDLLNVSSIRRDYKGILRNSPYYNVGVENPEFCNLAGVFSDKIFDIFYRFAKGNMKRGLPLIIAGGCGLNCDWNSKWEDSGLFSEIFVPPVVNDSGIAIGTAIDAQWHYTGNPKIDWNVYSGLSFDSVPPFDVNKYDVYEPDNDKIADMLANDLILGWVNGKYEIGPRALGNRSIIAAPFKDETRIRLNEIKQREQYRPIAPVCLEEDAAKWFGCNHPSPYMLYTYIANTDALAAVTHVNKTARLQTVSCVSNPNMYDLLTAFKKRTGYGVLCNTSLNFKGKGFINQIDDLSTYVMRHKLDGFVIDGRSYMLKSSPAYLAYLASASGNASD
jgi:hydroxymethyl cephem carbamoyltransferase